MSFLDTVSSPKENEESSSDEPFKICKICNIAQGLSNFYLSKHDRLGRDSYCKLCRSNHSKKMYQSDSKAIFGTVRAIKHSNKKKSGKINKATLKTQLRNYTHASKDVPCTDCGQKYPYYVMDFDHKPGFTKVDNVGSLVAARTSLEKLKEEISKCEVVCSNCHRVRTFNRGQFGRPKEAKNVISN